MTITELRKSIEELPLGNYYLGIIVWAEDLYQKITARKSLGHTIHVISEPIKK
jgi:hypothetical protein